MVSRVAKVPVEVPKGTEIRINGQDLTFKGKLGEVNYSVHPLVQVKLVDNVLQIFPNDLSSEANAIAGTTRAVANNMVVGVSNGFSQTGVGGGWLPSESSRKCLEFIVGLFTSGRF